jgi:hypothetical protein
VTRVTWGGAVDKQICRSPEAIGRKFRIWVARLNRAYRAIYIEREVDQMELIEVVEVNKHAY